jgi:hypothetical protein
MSVQINRDPFARITLTRELIEGSEGRPCVWCGARRLNKNLRLFAYYTESDGGMRTRHRGEFCSLGCQ